MPKDMGFTLPSPTAATRLATNWASIRDPLQPHRLLGTETVAASTGRLPATAIPDRGPVAGHRIVIAGDKSKALVVCPVGTDAIEKVGSSTYRLK